MTNTFASDNYAEEFWFFDDCCSALIRHQYVEAASILEKGLNENRDAVHAVDQSDILKRFLARFILLKRKLDAYERESKTNPLTSVDKPGRELSCSFCGKRGSKVRNLIAGSSTYICNECIEICNEIIDDETMSRL